MSLADQDTLSKQVEAVLPAFLGRQPWFQGERPRSVRVTQLEELKSDWPAMLWAVADADGVEYQLALGIRLDSMGSLPDRIVERAILGDVDSPDGHAILYDALFDKELALALLERVTEGSEQARLVRPMAHEQANSSLIFDERLVLKLFRRFQPGPNPDVEVTTALAQAGYLQVAQPYATWTRGEYDLAFCQEYLAGGSDGWHLALTSLRDLLADPEDPARAGGDFGGESRRLGQMTARMHLALAQALGQEPGDPNQWASALESHLRALDRGDLDAGLALAARLRETEDVGPSIRLHNDFHLGQVFRTDAGWFVIDFEGDPHTSLEERRQRHSPLKDVVGVLRSFQYASEVALLGRDAPSQEQLRGWAKAWEQRNRKAFLDGYFGTAGIDNILPRDAHARDVLLTALELDRAAYQAKTEADIRPTWAFIPQEALGQMLSV